MKNIGDFLLTLRKSREERNDVLELIEEKIFCRNLGFSAPIDRIKVIKRDQRISILTYTIIGTISVVGILLSIFFFIFNIIFRAHRFVEKEKNLRWIFVFSFLLVSFECRVRR